MGQFSTPVQKVQNKAACLITKKPRNEHVTPIMKMLHWLPVHLRIIFKTLVLVYKCQISQAPKYLCDLLCTRLMNRRLHQSDTAQLHQPINKKSIGNQAFGIAAPQLWNELPPVRKNAQTLNTFKRLLKTHLFKSYYI